jgi:hypothetical protein
VSSRRRPFSGVAPIRVTTKMLKAPLEPTAMFARSSARLLYLRRAPPESQVATETTERSVALFWNSTASLLAEMDSGDAPSAEGYDEGDGALVYSGSSPACAKEATHLNADQGWPIGFPIRTAASCVQTRSPKANGQCSLRLAVPLAGMTLVQPPRCEPNRVVLCCACATHRFYCASLSASRALKIDGGRSVGVTQRTVRLRCSPAVHHPGTCPQMPDDGSRWTVLPLAACGMLA